MGRDDEQQKDPLTGRLKAGLALLALAVVLFAIGVGLIALVPAAIGLYQLVVAGIGFGVREGRGDA